MDHTRINAFRKIRIDLIIIHKFKDQLTGRAGLGKNIILIGKMIVADVMIHAKRLLCGRKIFCGISQTIHVSAITCDKQIVYSPVRAVVLNIRCVHHESKDRRYTVQVDVRMHLGIIF